MPKKRLHQRIASYIFRKRLHAIVLLIIIISALYAGIQLKSVLIFFVALLSGISLISILAIFVTVAATPLDKSSMLRDFFNENWDDFFRDCSLFWSKQGWKRRVEQWEEHSKVYSELKLGYAASLAPGHGTTRLDYLSGGGRLTILESKFSALLTVQSLLGVLMGLAASNLGNQIKAALDCWGGWAKGLLALPALLWLITVSGCLITLGNVRWGDLWEEGKTHQEKEQCYVNHLARIIVVRTASLRVFSAVALVNLFLSTCIVMLLVSTSWPKPVVKYPPPVHLTPPQVAPSSWHAFNSGQTCTDDIGAWIKEIADSVSKSTSREGVSIGSADVLPLGPSLRAKYGDNIGLAFARARCVADRITRELSSRRIQVEIDVRVRDVLDRGKASAKDRVVKVEWFP